MVKCQSAIINEWTNRIALFTIRLSRFTICILILWAGNLSAQENNKLPLDSLAKHDSINSETKQLISTRINSLEPIDTTKKAKDTIVIIKPKHDPHIATRRSAMIPGWGQAYNREYWKIPLVYGALSIPVITFLYNNKWYKRCRDAYVIYSTKDSANYGNVDPALVKFKNDPSPLPYYRNSFRKDREVSILWFFIIWGINVADATVFGHLKNFDVSDDLSMQVTPSYNSTYKSTGFSLVFNLKDKPNKPKGLKY